MNPKKTENIDYFKASLPQLLNDPILKGKFVVIHNKNVKHSSDSFETALSWAVKSLPVDEFIVQQIIDPNDQVNFLRCAV